MTRPLRNNPAGGCRRPRWSARPGPVRRGREPKVLRLEEFIAASVKNSPEVFYELEKIRIADAGARKARGVYDVVFSAYYNHRYDEPFTEYSAVKIDRQTDDVAGISLERRFPRTGTRLKAGLEYTRSEWT